MTGTERKVFQKYYPPDFDPSRIPKAERGRNRQFIQRVMAPFNMQCNTCNEYIYKGRKFNMKRETAEGETYLGMKIFRFYFRCPNCLAEITFKTDIENVDYKMEQGATRLFDAFKAFQDQEREREHVEEEEKADAMKMLEKRTKMSKLEMEALGRIEEMQEMNRRREKVDALGFLESEGKKRELSVAEQMKLQEEEDEREVQRLLKRIEEERLPQPGSSEELEELRASSSTSVPPIEMITKPPIPPAPVKMGGAFTPSAMPSMGLVGRKATEKAKPKFMSGVVIKKRKTPSGLDSG